MEPARQVAATTARKRPAPSPPPCGPARKRYLRKKLKRQRDTKRRKRLQLQLKRAKACPAPPGPAPAPAPRALVGPRLRPQRPARPTELPVRVYSGHFGPGEAERLLWRAGFGPGPREAEALAEQGLDAAVASLVRPASSAQLIGGGPTTSSGESLAPTDAFGHDHLWWLDRMVRSNHPLVERMTLVWHDWFATSNSSVGSQKLMLEQNHLFRRLALGSFEQLLLDVTADPAMLLFLNGLQNRKGLSNENYARELMELFTLGADRGAYNESDVRELGRALTGFRSNWSAELGHHNFRLDAARFDGGTKTVFGQTGPWDWEDACRLCLYHHLHPSFFVEKLWSYFIPTPLSGSDRRALESVYVARDYAVAPVVEAILKHPDLHAGPAMMKPPVVFVAGMLRRLERGIETADWWWICRDAGQHLFRPPDVSGWDDTRWLDTGTVRARWAGVAKCLGKNYLTGAAASAYDPQEDAQTAVTRALAFWKGPPLSDETRAELLEFARTCLPAVMTSSQRGYYRALRQNALRQLIAASPDLQTC